MYLHAFVFPTRSVNIVKGEIHNVVWFMRSTRKWATKARFAQEIPLGEYIHCTFYYGILCAIMNSFFSSPLVFILFYLIKLSCMYTRTRGPTHSRFQVSSHIPSFLPRVTGSGYPSVYSSFFKCCHLS